MNPIIIRAAAFALVTCAIPAISAASDGAIVYPDRHLTLIIGGPPGGGTDILARKFSDRISTLLGQRVVIEYRLGASGNLAAMAVAQAKPDGYSILFGTRSSTLHKTMYPALEYDFFRDLAPVAMMARMPIGILVGNHVGANNLRDMIRLSKGRPDRISVAVLGVGTTSHLTSVLLQEAAGIRLQHVPYTELSRAITDVIGGRVDLLITQLSGAMSHVTAGTLRALAVTSAERVATLPGVPTIAEAGFPQVSADEWFAAFVPTGTPPAIVAKLNHAINEVLTDHALREDVAKMGYVLPLSGNTPKTLEKFLTDDNMRWTKVLQDHQIAGGQ